MTRRAQPEAQIQRVVFEHLRLRGVPGVYCFHPFSGGYRRPVEAAVYKGLGARAGLPDVIAIHRGCVFGLELKPEGGRVTPVQRETMAALQAAGAVCKVAVGLDAAIRVLEAWGLLRGRVS